MKLDKNDLKVLLLIIAFLIVMIIVGISNLRASELGETYINIKYGDCSKVIQQTTCKLNIIEDLEDSNKQQVLLICPIESEIKANIIDTISYEDQVYFVLKYKYNGVINYSTIYASLPDKNIAIVNHKNPLCENSRNTGVYLCTK